jgi:hypothetical protein
MTHEMFTDFQKIFKFKILWKLFQREPSFSMQTETQRVLTKLIVEFHNSAKALKIREATGLPEQEDQA